MVEVAGEVVGMVHEQRSVQVLSESVKSSARAWARDELLPAGGMKSARGRVAGRIERNYAARLGGPRA